MTFRLTFPTASLGFEKFTASPLMFDTPKVTEIEDNTPEDDSSKSDNILEEYWASRENTVIRDTDIEEPFKLGATISQNHTITTLDN